MKECNQCHTIKDDKRFYESKGNKCKACCTINRYIELHGPENTELIKSIIIEKYSRKIRDLDSKRNIYMERLQELTT